MVRESLTALGSALRDSERKSSVVASDFPTCRFALHPDGGQAERGCLSRMTIEHRSGPFIVKVSRAYSSPSERLGMT